MIKNVYCASYKVPVMLVWFYWNLNFLDGSKNTQTSNFMKLRPVEAEFFQAERRTNGPIDNTKLIVAFRSFAKAPKTIKQFS